MKIRNKKGQSTLEYIILVTAIVAVMVVFLRPDNTGALYKTVNTAYTTVTDEMTEAANALSNTAW